MRRFLIAAFMALGALGLAAGAASAQYVTPPGQTPSVGSAGFGGESAEVRGESVERPSAGSAGIAGAPAAGAAESGEAGDAGEAAQVAGVETSRADTLPPLEDRDLRAGTARSSEGSGLRALLAFTGVALAIMMVAGLALFGVGKILHSMREPQES
ncbi:MAG: hypothetical protein KY395_08010 [Actinobacteria bacterium]|nr:hypothetical protein [Actinomycetota bacterium]